MSLTMFFVSLSVAVVVMAVSVWFIVRQLKLNKMREQNIAKGEERALVERQKRIDSINVLLKVANTEEMNWIEASIRVKHLLDQLGIDLSDHDDISAFYIVTEETAHIPTHEQWKELPKQAKSKFLKEMEGCEARHVEHLLRAKQSLSKHLLSLGLV